MSGACPVWARRRPCCPLLLQAGTEARGVGGADSPAPLPQGAKAQPGLGRWRMLMVTQAPAGRTAWLPFSFSKSPPSSTFYSKCAAPSPLPPSQPVPRLSLLSILQATCAPSSPNAEKELPGELMP